MILSSQHAHACSYAVRMCQQPSALRDAGRLDGHKSSPCTVLSIYLDVACAVNLKPACSDGLQSAAYQNVDKQLSVWSWTISFKSGKLGPLRLGPRAALTFANDRVRPQRCATQHHDS